MIAGYVAVGLGVYLVAALVAALSGSPRSSSVLESVPINVALSPSVGIVRALTGPRWWMAPSTVRWKRRGQPDRMALVRKILARPEHIGPVRREAAAFARQLGAVDPDGVALAVSEALTNAVLHAYVDEPEPGEVELVAESVPDDGLRITVCDDGRGMEPRSDSPGAGFGLPLIASLAERFDVQSRSSGGSRLCMYFATAT